MLQTIEKVGLRWLLRFRKLDMSLKDQRQALVDTFINAIYLYDDKVLITFNYKEGTETVAFGEAVKAEKSSDMSARGAPDIERQIVRFGVLSLCRKAAAHFLHTVCTVARIGGFSAQGLSLWMTTPNCWHCCVSSCAAQATPNDVPRNTNCYKTARPPAARRPCRFILYFAKSGSFPRPHSATLTGRTYTPSAA